MKRRADGYYQQSITLPAAGGGSKRKVFYGKTQAEVKKKVTAARAAAMDGIIEGKRTVEDYCRAWLASEAKDLEMNTLSQYSYELAHVTDAIGKKKMSTVSRADIQGVVNEYLDRPCTARAIKRIFSRVCETAVADRILPTNPCRFVKSPDYDPAEKKADIDTDAILALDWTEEQELVLLFLVCCGLRREEVLGLKWEDVDFERRRIHIRRAVVFDGNNPIIKKPKSKKSKRDLPFPVEYIERLKAHAKAAGLIIHRDGKPLTKSAFRKMWEKIEKRLIEEGFGKLTPHNFRHAYCSRLYYMGVPVKKAQMYMGHASVATTLNIYTHCMGDEDEDTEEIDNVFALSVKGKREKDKMIKEVEAVSRKFKERAEIDSIQKKIQDLLKT